MFTLHTNVGGAYIECVHANEGIPSTEHVQMLH